MSVAVAALLCIRRRCWKSTSVPCGAALDGEAVVRRSDQPDYSLRVASGVTAGRRGREGGCLRGPQLVSPRWTGVPSAVVMKMVDVV